MLGAPQLTFRLGLRPLQEVCVGVSDRYIDISFGYRRTTSSRKTHSNQQQLVGYPDKPGDEDLGLQQQAESKP